MQFLHKSEVFRNSQKGANHLGFFCYKFCCRELSKIALSGHTAGKTDVTPPPLANRCQFLAKTVENWKKCFCCEKANPVLRMYHMSHQHRHRHPKQATEQAIICPFFGLNLTSYSKDFGGWLGAFKKVEKLSLHILKIPSNNLNWQKVRLH